MLFGGGTRLAAAAAAAAEVEEVESLVVPALPSPTETNNEEVGREDKVALALTDR